MVKIKTIFKICWAFLWRWILVGLLIEAAIASISVCCFGYHKPISEQVRGVLGLIVAVGVIYHIEYKHKIRKLKF